MDVNNCPACEPYQSQTTEGGGQVATGDTMFNGARVRCIETGSGFPDKPRRGQGLNAQQPDTEPKLVGVRGRPAMASRSELLSDTSLSGCTSIGRTKKTWHDLADDRPLSIAEVCDLTDLCRTFVSGQIRAGNLVARKAGRRTLILQSDFQAWLQGLPKIQPATDQGAI